MTDPFFSGFECSKCSELFETQGELVHHKSEAHGVVEDNKKFIVGWFANRKKMEEITGEPQPFHRPTTREEIIEEPTVSKAMHLS